MIFGVGITLILIVGIIYWFENRVSPYRNDNLGFSIKYPKQWIFKEDPGDVAVIFYAPLENKLDLSRENVNVVVEDISDQPKSLEQYSAKSIRQVQAVFEGYIQVVDSSPTFLAGRNAHQFIFIAGENPQLEFFIVWTIDNLKAYQITYTSAPLTYEKYVKPFKKMLASFKIIN